MNFPTNRFIEGMFSICAKKVSWKSNKKIHRWLIRNENEHKKSCGTEYLEHGTESVVNTTPCYTPQFLLVHNFTLLNKQGENTDLERPQTTANLNLNNLFISFPSDFDWNIRMKARPHILLTHGQYSWGNSFVYSLRATHCFFIYNIVIDFVYAQLSIAQLFPLFALSIRLSLFVEKQKLKIMENWFSVLMFLQRSLLLLLCSV